MRAGVPAGRNRHTGLQPTKSKRDHIDDEKRRGEKGRPRTHCEPRGMVPVETVTRGIAIRVKFADGGGGGGGTGLMETVW